MEAKRVRDSSVITAQLMNPQDANPAGNVHGGVVVKIIDEAAGVVAARHARSNVVTASIDHMDFLHPIFVGTFFFSRRASITLAERRWRSGCGSRRRTFSRGPSATLHPRT